MHLIREVFLFPAPDRNLKALHPCALSVRSTAPAGSAPTLPIGCKLHPAKITGSGVFLHDSVEFMLHDLRRTFITETLATSTPLATVQAAAVHARGETTLRYAQAVDARQARQALKLRYG